MPPHPSPNAVAPHPDPHQGRRHRRGRQEPLGALARTHHRRRGFRGTGQSAFGRSLQRQRWRPGLDFPGDTVPEFERVMNSLRDNELSTRSRASSAGTFVVSSGTQDRRLVRRAQAPGCTQRTAPTQGRRGRIRIGCAKRATARSSNSATRTIDSSTSVNRVVITFGEPAPIGPDTNPCAMLGQTPWADRVTILGDRDLITFAWQSTRSISLDRLPRRGIRPLQAPVTAGTPNAANCATC